MLHSHKVHLNLGLKHPVRILHFSDIHIAVADDIDGDGLKEHSAERRNVFFGLAGFPERSPIGYLEEAMEYSKNFDCTVITGDFNCLANTTEYQTIIDADYRVTNTFGENVRTYQGYNDNGGSIIDFCFVNDLFPIVSYKVCEEKTDGEWISDHNAIVSELILLPTYDSIDIPTGENAQ